MAKIVKETVFTHDSKPSTTINSSVSHQASDSQTVENTIYFVFGILEVLLVFRLFFKLTGASLASGFVSFIYTLTGIFVLPFMGIFHRGVATGFETASILEPETIVAIIVYMILAWGIVKFIQIVSRDQS